MLKTFRKMKVMFMAIALVIVATASTSPAVVSYATEQPYHYTNDGARCNNTYRKYTHTGFSHSRYAYTHVLSDGRECEASRLIYLHRVECSVCHHVFYTNAPGECTEEHSKCGSHTVNEPHIGAK